MTRPVTIAAAAAAILLTSGAAFAAPPKKGTQPRKAAAPAAVEAPEPEVALTPGQLEAAQRVFTGEASCEFGEKIHVVAVDGHPGRFKLQHKKASYLLVPEETTTGAVRLEDRRAGIVWLQIPAKSMLMNAKVGQRLVDDCHHAEQHTTAAAPGPEVASAIGIAAAPR